MKPFLTALTFLTVIKINLKDYDLENAPFFFPLIGFLIGVPAYLFLQSDIYLKEVLTLLYLIIITGALHLDGLSDTCDGIFSHRDRSKKLEIMKDSRIGAVGSISLILIILTKYELLKTVLPSFIPISLFFGRFVGILFISSLPYARADGTGKPFENFNILSKNQFLFYLIASFLPILFILKFSTFLIVTTCAILLSYFFSKCFLKLLGGYTGDTVGAVIEVSEVSILYLMVVISIY